MSELQPVSSRRKLTTIALIIVAVTVALVALLWFSGSRADSFALEPADQVGVVTTDEETSTPAPTDAPRERIAAPEFWVLGAIMLAVVGGAGVGMLVMVPTMRPRRNRRQGPSE